MEGPWIEMPKTPESTEREGPVVTLMHDDAVTRELGFAGGFVGGPNLEGVMAAAIPASFGHLWYEGGVHSARIFKPVYAGEEVRVVWAEVEPDPGDKRKIQYWLEKKDGERAAAGWAAVGDIDKLVAPWERSPAGAEPADDVLPSTQVGDKLPPRNQIISRGDMFMGVLDRIQDTNWWYRIASPWGDPLLPPYLFGSMVLRYTVESSLERGQTDDTRLLWMYAGLDVIVYRPVFIDHTYRLEGRVCEKGRSARSVFVVRECDIDDSNGVRVARARFRASLLQPPTE